MQKPLFSSLFLYLLAAVCVWVLTSLRGCEHVGQTSIASSAVAIRDTVYVPEYYPYPIERVRQIVVRDSVLIERPVLIMPGADSCADVLLIEVDRGDSLLLYAGSVEDAACTYRYTAGVHHDSLAFLCIERACEVPIVASSENAPLSKRPRNRDFSIGLKAGWMPGSGLAHVGVQTAWRGLYGSANLAPASRRWLFEAGVLWPIGPGRAAAKTAPIQFGAANPE